MRAWQLQAEDAVLKFFPSQDMFFGGNDILYV